MLVGVFIRFDNWDNLAVFQFLGITLVFTILLKRFVRIDMKK